MAVIRGAGGGSSDSQRTPVESPDSIRSRAYARVVDLVSEGEIVGLVDGLKSIYLDDTPLQAENGSFNFSGVVVQTRQGTQAQTHVPGFSSVESTTVVGIEVKASAPVVRTFTNPNVDAVEITVGIPSLLYQDVTTGDTVGTFVGLQFDLQSNGGGYVTQPAFSEAAALTWTGSVLTSGATAGTHFGITTYWTPPSTPHGLQSASYSLQYRLVGAGSWTTYGTRTVKHGSSFLSSGKGSDYVSLSLPSGAYEFRSVLLTSYGTLSMAGTVDVPSYTLLIQGKTTTRYQRTVRIPLTGSGPWDIRVRRTVPDSTTSYLQNKTFVDLTNEVVDSKLRYPNSAYVAMSLDSSQFSNIPRRGYHLRGLKVKVPSNYDPATRTYTGAWDGTFQIAWTDNPAWCFYDLLTNTRYGLGEFIPEVQVDKWSLYTIAKYCDELVPDGTGDTEPRFTCNLYLQTRAEAFKVINDMASIFRGLVYWSSASIIAVQDSPADAAYLYTPANVIDGAFMYQGSSGKARHTVAMVTWNDPADMYRQKVEYVEDRDGIARYGVVPTEVAAFGCTSRGQANRVGRWLLFTERLQSEVVNFKTGLDGNLCRPGQVIKIADPARAGVRMGGRLAAATTTTATLDAPATLAAGETYTLSTLKADGTVQESTVTTAAGTVSSLTVSPAFSEAPATGSLWILAGTTVQAQLFRVISVTENSAAEFEITALAHAPDKYAAVEQEIALDPRSISVITSRPDAPTNGAVSEYLYEAATDLKTMAVFSWDASSNAVGYRVSYQRDSNNVVELPETRVNSVTLQDAQPGSYAVTVRAINAVSMLSAPLRFTGAVLGKTAPPADVQDLRLQVQTGSGLLSWALATDLDVRLGGRLLVRHSTAMAGAKWSTSVPIAEFSGSATSGAVPLLAGTYLAKFEDTSGSVSVNATAVVTDAPAILNYNVVVTSDQAPGFAGAKTGMEISGSQLVLASSSTWDDIADFDAAASIDGGTVASGSYEWSAPIDTGAVYSCRVTADIGVLSYDTSNVVDGWTSVDAVTDVDGTLAGDSADVRLYISTTNDDPTLAPSWSAWKLFTVGDYLARAYRFRMDVARGTLPTQQVAFSRLAITIDVPDRVEGDNLVSVGTSGLEVTFSAPFYSTPAIAITADSMATGDYYNLSGKSAFGFFVQFFNSGGTPIAKTMDWIAKGFGYKV